MQRVNQASVVADGKETGRVGVGLVVLLGVTHDDDAALARRTADKVAGLRIMRDEQSVVEAGGSVLVISQFTLYGDVRKGRRPTWTAAAPGPVAEPLYDEFCMALRSHGLIVETGVFGADMQVSLVNDGPTTLLVDL